MVVAGEEVEEAVEDILNKDMDTTMTRIEDIREEEVVEVEVVVEIGSNKEAGATEDTAKTDTDLASKFEVFFFHSWSSIENGNFQ